MDEKFSKVTGHGAVHIVPNVIRLTLTFGKRSVGKM